MKKDILGMKIDDISVEQAVETVEGWLSKPGKHYIVTPNPEIVMRAQQDPQLKEILNQADLAIPDGVGLKLSGDIVCHTPGIDLMEALIKVANHRGFTVGLLGGRNKVAEKAVERLKYRYQKLKISFATSNIEVDEEGREIESRIKNKEFRADILFVAFGPPKQEKWIAKNLEKIPVKVAMGVGGAFDYLSGRVPRAPLWLRALGFEWLFRLITQPWRIKRQVNLIKYLLKILTH